MRIGLLAVSVLSLAALTLPAIAKAPVHRVPVPQKVLRVSTHGNGPAHQRITLALDKAALVQLDAAAATGAVSLALRPLGDMGGQDLAMNTHRKDNNGMVAVIRYGMTHGAAAASNKGE